MLVYSICYYYGRNNSKHIITHLNSFNKIKTMKEDIHFKCYGRFTR